MAEGYEVERRISGGIKSQLVVPRKVSPHSCVALFFFFPQATSRIVFFARLLSHDGNIFIAPTPSPSLHTYRSVDFVLCFIWGFGREVQLRNIYRL